MAPTYKFAEDSITEQVLRKFNLKFSSGKKVLRAQINHEYSRKISARYPDAVNEVYGRDYSDQMKRGDRFPMPVVGYTGKTVNVDGVKMPEMFFYGGNTRDYALGVNEVTEFNAYIVDTPVNDELKAMLPAALNAPLGRQTERGFLSSKAMSAVKDFGWTVKIASERLNVSISYLQSRQRQDEVTAILATREQNVPPGIKQEVITALIRHKDNYNVLEALYQLYKDLDPTAKDINAYSMELSRLPGGEAEKLNFINQLRKDLGAEKVATKAKGKRWGHKSITGKDSKHRSVILGCLTKLLNELQSKKTWPECGILKKEESDRTLQRAKLVYDMISAFPAL
jgi:hypothetical protein